MSPTLVAQYWRKTMLRDSGARQLSEMGSNPGGEGWEPPSIHNHVLKNTLNLLGLLDNGDDFHFGSALWGRQADRSPHTRLVDLYQKARRRLFTTIRFNLDGF